MVQIPTRRRQLARILSTVLVVIGVAMSGYLTIRYQVNVNERKYIVFTAQEAVSGIDRLLNEANQAAERARKYLVFPCSQDIQHELNRLTIQQPHLRVINLISGNQLKCSSFSALTSQTMDFSQYVNHRLSLRSGSVITPGNPLLILLSSFPEGSVAVSIGATQLVDILSLPNNHSTLTLQVGARSLSSQGQLWTIQPQEKTHSVSSLVYPYSVVFSESPPLSFQHVLDRGKIPISLFTLFGIISGLLVWHFSFRQPTPYDHLIQAIKQKDIIPWYQPVISAQTGEIHGVEVLARWKHTSGMFILPDEFIPQAEKSGLILPLTGLLMSRVAEDLAPLIHRIRQPFHIAFNISAAHLHAADQTVSDFRRFQAAFPDGCIRLIAEITEREPFEQSPGLDNLLFRLRQQGVQIALDDFGTGYSNLGYLNTLPIDYIKIDRSFINYLSEDKGSDRLVECVVSMAETLGLGIVAEGVETEYQASWLASHHVTFLQGYYFSRPLPLSALIRMIVLQDKHFDYNLDRS
jgi:Predicted signal transduction protein containing sensor and EAL domains